MMNRDSMLLDPATLDELRWLSECITIEAEKPRPPRSELRTKRKDAPSSPKVTNDPKSPRSVKYKRDSPSRRPVLGRRAYSHATASPLDDLRETDSEKLDSIHAPSHLEHLFRPVTPPRFSGLTASRPKDPLDTSTDNAPPDASNVRPNKLLKCSSSVQESAWIYRRPNRPYVGNHDFLLRSTSDPLPTSHSLPTPSSLAGLMAEKGDCEYFDLSSLGDNSEETSPSPSPRRRLSKRSSLSKQGAPLWTSMMRTKSRPEREESLLKLKAQPSQSLFIQDFPPTSYTRPVELSKHGRACSVKSGISNSSTSSLNSPPPTPISSSPCLIPGLALVTEDIEIGASRPPTLYLEKSALFLSRQSSRRYKLSQRKNSLASDTTSSSTTTDASESSCMSNKSVTFAEQPTVHYPSRGYWDSALQTLDFTNSNGIDLEATSSADSGHNDIIIDDPIPVNESLSDLTCSVEDDPFLCNGPIHRQIDFVDPRFESDSTPTPEKQKWKHKGLFRYLKKGSTSPRKDISRPLAFGSPSRLSNRSVSSSPVPRSRPGTPALIPSRSETPISLESSRPGTPFSVISMPETPVSTNSRPVTPALSEDSGFYSLRKDRRPSLFRSPSSRGFHASDASSSLPSRRLRLLGMESTDSFRSTKSSTVRSVRSVSIGSVRSNVSSKNSSNWLLRFGMA